MIEVRWLDCAAGADGNPVKKTNLLPSKKNSRLCSDQDDDDNEDNDDDEDGDDDNDDEADEDLTFVIWSPGSTSLARLTPMMAAP